MNKTDFPILKQIVHKQPLVYLDNAATSQKPQVVIDALVEAYSQWNSNIHRGVHYLSQVATKHHEEARDKIAQFIHAQSSEEVIFTKGTTDSINTIAFCLGELPNTTKEGELQSFISEGDEIIVSALEHHSNIVPWQMLCERKKAVLHHIPLRDDLTIDLDAFKTLLSSKTKVVSIAHVSNVLGIINPIEEIIRLAHQYGAIVVVDGAQSVPHMPIDVQKLNCDFLVFSGHKMYGPTGIGVLYGKKEWLNKIPPYQGGGEMINHVRWSGTTYNELPYKFEAGTPNYVGSYALSKAIDYIQSIGMSSIMKHEMQLTTYCEEQLKQIEGVHIYAANQLKAGAVSFNVYISGKLIHPFDIGTLLDQQGVAIRTGHHCAEPLIEELGVPGTARVSFGLYNDKEDIDIFINALKRAISMLV
ncbi:MAG: cysteine desulfurase [Paludibacteraceae bacterium]|nr:cysteine desulfurase [Paludibacteraceae bacterium]